VANLASDLSKDQQMAPQIAHHQHSSLGNERPNYDHHHQALCTSLLARLAAPRSHNRPERLGRPPLARGTEHQLASGHDLGRRARNKRARKKKKGAK